jgi:hypothetical protein
MRPETAMNSQTLGQLYPTDTPLAEVSPDFHGMRFHKWNLLKIAEQAEAYLKSLPANAKETAPINRKAVATPRDNYGAKGL